MRPGRPFFVVELENRGRLRTLRETLKRGLRHGVKQELPEEALRLIDWEK